MSLSVETPGHLHKIGLLEEAQDDHEADINFLMSVALQKIAFLPFGYLMDLYRWNIFEGNYTHSEYNARWWQHRCETARDRSH
ncbi:PREDICTED: angiotensin-converting enzyme-like [Priapulus caudatus]|uniref:Angiotensin-converting enzyme n=1 Tax=Priapulus caudatus TaxID=37621 RepID=A0ABM1F712_PRICU|nr:PREDICTED: angiotensin-converting enzyme-like [Priapulus caudatus]